MKRASDYCSPLSLVSIRRAKLEDAAAISSLLSKWLNEGPVEGRLKDIRKATRAKEILVAEYRRSKSLVGFLHTIVHNDPISGGPLAYITAFYVRKRFREKGIGSLLLKQFLDNSIVKEVATSHPRAIKLYRRFGFSQFKAETGEILQRLNLNKGRIRKNRTL